MKNFFFLHHRKDKLLLMAGDFIISIICIAFILFFHNYSSQGSSYQEIKVVLAYIFMPCLTLFFLYLADLYEPFIHKRADVIFFIIGLTMLIVLALYSAFAYFINVLRPGRMNLLLFILVTVLLTYLWHSKYPRLISIRPRRVIFVGSDPIFDAISAIISSSFSKYYTIADTCIEFNQCSSLSIIKDTSFDIIIYSYHSPLTDHVVNNLVSASICNRPVINAQSFYQQITHKFPSEFVNDIFMLLNARRHIFMPSIATNLKRGMDILLIMVMVPFAFPIFLVCALAVKLTSKGPALFTQERLGQNEVPFRLYKLRTMVDNAERFTGPRWSTEDDPRITRVGRILRKLRLDELPQLWNVLKGDMTVVGPRPIRKHFADILAKEVPFYRLRFLAKPGLTGWAQVNYDYAGSNQGQSEKQEYDLFYLINQSIWLDLFILFKTVKVMVCGKGT